MASSKRISIYRVAQKERNSYDQLFQEYEGQNKQVVQVVCIFAYTILTPRSLISMKAFWIYGHFSETMSFSKFATSVSKVTIDVPTFSIVWLPRVKCLLLLWKTKTAGIKRRIHYVTLQYFNPGKTLKEIPPYLKRDFSYKRGKFRKWHCFRKMALESKRLNQNHWSWCDFAGKKNCLRIYALTKLIKYLIYLKLVIAGVAFFLGHPA